MFFYSTFKYSFKRLLHYKLDYLFLFFQFIVLSDLVVYFLPDSFLYINFIISLSLVIYKKRLRVKELVLFLLGFFSVALIPMIFWGFDIRLYGGYMLRIATGLLIIQYFRVTFFSYFENIIFILAYISIFLFIVQQFIPQFFNLFDLISRSLLSAENYEKGRHYFLIYFYRPALSFRNSGFMWEPAAYGGVLTWAILFNLYINKFIINNKLIVLVFAAFTTFSIGFFTYFIIILALYLVQKNVKATKYLIILVPLFYVLYDLPIVQKNKEIIETKLEAEEEIHIDNAIDLSANQKSYSRVGGFIVNGRYFIKWPFGYGLIDATSTSDELKYLGASPNSLMKILIQWGLIGFIIIILSIRGLIIFLRNNYYTSINSTGIVLSMIIILGPFIGNPFSKQPLTFVILLIGLFLNKKYLFKHSISFMKNKNIKIKYLANEKNQIII